MNDLSQKYPNGAERFHQMGQRITHNADAAHFGGAAVIIPPGGGEPIEVLILDSQGDVAQFWGTIKGRIAMVLQNLDDQAKMGFGRPR